MFIHLLFGYVLRIAATEIDKEFPEGWGIEFEYNISHLCSNREQRKNGKLHGCRSHKMDLIC